MSVPHVDTFEHDIAEEIKTREATMTDIASAGGDLGNTTPTPVQTSNLLVVLGFLFIIAVIGAFGWLFYTYIYKGGIGSTSQTGDIVLPDVSNRLLAISPLLHDAIGGSVGTITKSEYGYTMQVLSYSDVFSYMIKNEAVYADELALAVGSPRDVATTSVPFSFTDVTLNNQTMRVGTSGSSTLVYAFVNTKALVISSSTEGILALRSSILTK